MNLLACLTEDFGIGEAGVLLAVEEATLYVLGVPGFRLALLVRLGRLCCIASEAVEKRLASSKLIEELRRPSWWV